MPEITLKDGSVVLDPRLDRLVQFDDQSLQYPVRSLLSPRQLQTPRSKTWTVGVWLDQGREGACVGFGISAELAAKPYPVPGITNEFAREKIYWEAQRTDPWPGGSYPGADPQYEGTSVLCGIKVAASLGYYTAYHWAFSEEDLMLAVGYKGPAVIGVNWYEGMFDPDANGYISPTGKLAGGHCTLVYAVNVRSGYYKIWNSWSASWGNNGTAKITRADMARLMSEDGEVCIPDTRVAVLQGSAN